MSSPSHSPSSCSATPSSTRGNASASPDRPPTPIRCLGADQAVHLVIFTLTAAARLTL